MTCIQPANLIDWAFAICISLISVGAGIGFIVCLWKMIESADRS